MSKNPSPSSTTSTSKTPTSKSASMASPSEKPLFADVMGGPASTPSAPDKPKPPAVRSDSSTHLKSPDVVKLKAVYLTALMRLPEYTHACSRIYHVSARDPSRLNIQGSNCVYAEVLELEDGIIRVGTFEMPVQGGGVLGYVRA